MPAIDKSEAIEMSELIDEFNKSMFKIHRCHEMRVFFRNCPNDSCVK